MSISRGNIYSFVHCQFYRVNSAGVPVGQLDPDALVADSTSHAYKVTGAVSADFPTPEFGRVTFRDGSKYQGAVDTGLIDPGTITISTNFYDADLNTLFFGVKKDTTTIANTVGSSFGWTTSSPFDIGAILTAQIYSRDTATLGASQFINYIIPRAQARISAPSFNQDNGENPSTAEISLQLKISNTDVLGIAFGTNQGFEGNQAIMYTITSAAPYALTTYIEDGVSTGYTTAYLPTSDDVATGNTTNYFAQNGVVTAPTSISTTTGDVVITPGSSGHIANALYQTNFTTA